MDREPRCKSRRILVVDDNEGAARLVLLLLQKLGDHQIEMAHDGCAALERIEATRPDLVLLDISMPQMDGYEVARTVRSRQDFPQPYLVAFTGYDGAEDIEAATAAGFDEHVVKPPSVAKLKELVDQLDMVAQVSPPQASRD